MVRYSFQEVTKESQLPPFRYFDKSNLAIAVTIWRVAEWVRDDERSLCLGHLDIHPHTVSS
jgi:hypothetical protein